MPDKPHVLFISSWFPARDGSAGTFVEMHLLALQSRGCKCAILLNGEVTLGNFLASRMRKKKFLNFRRREDITFIENLTIHYLPLRMYSNPTKQRKENILNHTGKALNRYMSEHGVPDVLFHHGVFDYCYLSAFVAQELEIPIWYMENSPKISSDCIPCANTFDNPTTLRAFVEDADRRFAVTAAYVEKMQALFDVPFELCPNVVTDDFFDTASVALRSGEYFQFINVAILNERKNQKLLVSAFATAFKGNKFYRLLIAGDGPLQGELEEQVQKLDLSDQVSILGFQSRDRIVQLLDESHCFVLSSHAETFGVVLVEAMARGLPIVSSRIAGPEELVTPDTGLLFESDDTTALATAMKKITQEPETFDAAHIRASAKARFGPDAVKNVLFPNG